MSFVILILKTKMAGQAIQNLKKKKSKTKSTHQPIPLGGGGETGLNISIFFFSVLLGYL